MLLVNIIKKVTDLWKIKKPRIKRSLNKINTDLKESGSNLVKQAKEELEKQLRKELQAQADKIINEANKRLKKNS